MEAHVIATHIKEVRRLDDAAIGSEYARLIAMRDDPDGGISRDDWCRLQAVLQILHTREMARMKKRLGH